MRKLIKSVRQLHCESKFAIASRRIVILTKLPKKLHQEEEQKNREFVYRETLINVYNASNSSQFDHCCEVWDAIGIELQKLQKLQYLKLVCALPW